MRMGDRAKDLYKVFREHTEGIKNDRTNTRQGYTVENQSEIDGRYELSNPGDENGWGFWKHGFVENSNIDPKENSRVLSLSNYMIDNPIIENLDNREISTYFQAAPVIMKKNGIYAIFSGDVGNILQGKEIIDIEENNPDKVKNILGFNSPGGMPGILVQSLDQAKHNQYFVPSGNILSVDHFFGGLSTRIAEVKENGYVDVEFAALDCFFNMAKDEAGAKIIGLNCSKSGKDTTGYGLTVWQGDGHKIVAYLSNIKNGILHPGNDGEDKHQIGTAEDGTIINPVHIDTNANFYMDKTKDGPLDIENGVFFPATQEPSEIEYYAPIHCRYNNNKGKWGWYVAQSTGSDVLALARVAWNIQEIDLSEAEIVTYSTETGEYTATEVKVWIDAWKSEGVSFETAGTNTIFRLKLVKKEHSRLGDVRDLYRISHCIEDYGNFFTHFKTTLKTNNQCVGQLLSKSLVDPVWDDSVAAKIKTIINNIEKDNIWRARISEQWNADQENYNYLELSGLAKGIWSLFRPIQPVLDNIMENENKYKSYITKDEISIAYYSLA